MNKQNKRSPIKSGFFYFKAFAIKLMARIVAVINAIAFITSAVFPYTVTQVCLLHRVAFSPLG